MLLPALTVRSQQKWLGIPPLKTPRIIPAKLHFIHSITLQKPAIALRVCVVSVVLYTKLIIPQLRDQLNAVPRGLMF